MRHYEVMIILDPSLDERTVAPSLENYLNVIRTSGGSVEKVDVWGKRRLAYEINKHSEGIYALLDLNSEPDAVKEMDRQLSLTESVLRTKVLRREPAKARNVAKAAKAAKAAARAAAAK
ncbi:MAG TPA: 30S ribosomal protein S6 [Pseudonocardiaceae bacterium]|jgi:small subunit ribosomal protein S6|nr:30S ribosomal protein S6 [Pseudonocardiaceae bacterium]